MKRFLAALVCAILVSFPSSTLADTVSSTATVSVTIMPQPMAAVVLPGCEFIVEAGAHEAFCNATLIAADPTLRNSGWKVMLSASDFSCECGGQLVPNALTIDSASNVVLINGQDVDRTGGPRLQANAIGRSDSPSQPLLVAKPNFGNGAYSVTLTLRLKVPANTIPGTYIPSWTIKLADAVP